MCEFCHQHGEGQKWYLNAKNYSEDLMADAKRRKFIEGFTDAPEDKMFKMFEEFDSRFDSLNRTPDFVRKVLSWRATSQAKKQHYGQVVPIEDVERIFGFVNSVVRIACVCRYAALRSEQRYCYGISMAPNGGQMAEYARQSGFTSGPGSMGLETLTKEEALAAFREHEKESLCHSVWTFVTPFIGGICNCDRGECGAMRATVDHHFPMMFKAEYVAQVDPEVCTGCRQCMRACQFGAIGYSAALGKAMVKQRDCYGCGICRAHCKKGAIKLEDRSKVAVAANRW